MQLLAGGGGTECAIPDAVAQFNASPEAQAWLHELVDSPPPRRRAMLLEMANTPEAASFHGIVLPLANTCRK